MQDLELASADRQTTSDNRVRTSGIVIIAVVAACFALYFGREILVPIAFAVLLNAVLQPLVARMGRVGIPSPIAAGILVLTLMAAGAGIGLIVKAPIKDWMDHASERFDKAKDKLQGILGSVQEMGKVATKMQEATAGPATRESSPAPVPAPQVPAGAAGFVGFTRQAVTALVETLLLLYLLLASGQMFVRKIIKVTPLWQDKKRAEQIVDESQQAVKKYLVATAAINFGQALIVGLVLWWLGMPTPLLWGGLCFLLEFIPYMGATVMVTMLSVIAFGTFDSLGHILAVPGSYLVITTIQNNVISPYVYGQHLKLNPVAVLVGVLVWWFLWGAPGAFLAVPIMATIKIVADRAAPLKAVGEFLGE